MNSTTATIPDELKMLSVAAGHDIIGKQNISRGALYAAIRRGELPAVRVGRRILLNRRALLNFLNGVTK